MTVDVDILQRIYFSKHGKFANLRRPKLFTEKIQYRKIHDRDPRMPRLTDKIEAKNYAASILGENWVSPIIWLGDSLPDRHNRHWPAPFVIKCSHGSRMNYFVQDVESINWQDVEEKIDIWCATRFGASLGEWAYQTIRPRILVEPFVSDGDAIARDIKFYVFRGRAQIIEVTEHRQAGTFISIYDRDWQLQPARWKSFPSTSESLDNVEPLQKMLSAAELLALDFEFVRIDFFNYGNASKFAEFTFYPWSGYEPLIPESLDRQLGDCWIL